jgi:hypothetical protein
MKINLTILFLYFSSVLIAQEFKTINANQANDSDFFDYEDYDENMNPIGEMEFLKGCSWYCGGTVKSIIASSELNENNGINYSPSNAHDFDKNTAWVEGSPDYGIGEYIEYHFNFDETNNYDGGLGINRILIANGYKKSLETWKNNSRIKKLKVYLNDEPYVILNLLDSFEVQTVEIDEITFPAKKTTKLKFEIIDIYKGNKYNDTALSLLMFEGTGVH